MEWMENVQLYPAESFSNIPVWFPSSSLVFSKICGLKNTDLLCSINLESVTCATIPFNLYTLKLSVTAPRIQLCENGNWTQNRTDMQQKIQL